jgi:hypothetical protein
MKNEFDTDENVTVNIEESFEVDYDVKQAEKEKSFKRADPRRLNIDPYADKDLLEDLY